MVETVARLRLELGTSAVLLEVRAAQTRRLKVLNRYLVDLFVRTRREAPAEIILDIDATDDPTVVN